MKNETNKTIAEGRKFRRLINKENNTWGRFSGWCVTDKPFKKAVTINNPNT